MFDRRAAQFASVLSAKEQIGGELEHLEKTFKKKDVQYQELQSEFQEVFEMDDLTDEEGCKLDDFL